MSEGDSRERGDFCPSPRPYQAAILNQAMRENTIVFLPPGTGKTFVAIMLIKNLSGDTKNKISAGGKRSFFLLDSNVLTQQRRECIAKYTNCSVGPRSEEDPCLRRCKESTWRKAFDKYQVFIMKAKRFAEVLKNRFIELKNVNLLIIDECHSATKKVAVIKILNEFELCPTEERPRLLGLTSTLLEKEVPMHRIERAIAKLERRLHGRVASIGDLAEIQRFIPSPIEKHIPYDEHVQFKFLESLKTQIKCISDFVMGYGGMAIKNDKKNFDAHILNQDIDLSRQFVRDLLDVWYNVERMGIYGGSIAARKLMMYVQRLGAQTKKQESAMVYMTFIKILVFIRETLNKKMEGACEIAKIYEYSSCQVTTLLDILKASNLGNNRCIIFVERRSTAEVLFNILKAASNNIETLSFMRPEFVVGVGLEPVTSTLRQYANEGTLDVFERLKSGEINILVTNDVSKDGFDMPECKLVIRFDVPPTYRSYILSKAWATLDTSYYIIFTPRKEKREVWKIMLDYKAKEDFLNKILGGECNQIKKQSENS